MTTSVVVVLAAALVVVAAWFDPDGIVATTTWRARSTGWVALGLLVLSSFVSLLPFGGTRRARRALGIAGAVVAIGHAVHTVRSPLVPALELLFYEPMFRAGAITLVVLVLLLATSFPRVVRTLRVRRWAALHALAPVALLTATHHVLLAPHARVDVAVALVGVAIVLIVWRALRALRRAI